MGCICDYCKQLHETEILADQCCEVLREEDRLHELYHPKMDHSITIRLSKQERNLMGGLLNMAANGWYSKEVLPRGFKSTKQAEAAALTLLSKIE